MSRNDVDREDAKQVFLATQDMSIVTVGTIADEFATINKSYARSILARLTDLGLLYEASPQSTSTHEGYHWDQGAEVAFNDAWDNQEVKPAVVETKTASATPKTCLCGCGEQVAGGRNLYRPGHDARHASAVAREIVASGEGDEGRINSIIAVLPSDALKAKALAQAGRAVAKAAAKALGQQSRTTAQWVEGHAKVGRWIYPARKKPNATKIAQVNERRDGTGAWKDLSLAKFVEGPVPVDED